MRANNQAGEIFRSLSGHSLFDEHHLETYILVDEPSKGNDKIFNVRGASRFQFCVKITNNQPKILRRQSSGMET